MPFALVTIGLVMVITGVRNTYGALGTQLRADFTGPGNFMYWIASIGVIGSVGYVDSLRTFSNMFMALVIVAMVLKNGGVFSQFKAALDAGPQSPAAAPIPSTSGQSSSSVDTSKIAQFADVAAAFA